MHTLYHRVICYLTVGSNKFAPKANFRTKNLRADAKKLHSAANFAGILQGSRQISQERSQAQTLNTPPTTQHPTSPHYPHAVTSQNPEPNIIVISPNISYPSPHSHTHSSPRHTPVQRDTCPCPPRPGPTLSPLTRGTDTDDHKFSFFPSSSSVPRHRARCFCPGRTPSTRRVAS